MFERDEEINIVKQLFGTHRKIMILFGPRQSGKTTLAKKIIKRIENRVEVNADLHKYKEVFSSFDLHKMKEVIGSTELLFIDEAQNIPEVGANLKILYDEMPELKILITGSSAIDIASKTKEALTGRTKTFLLFPLSYHEIASKWGDFETASRLHELLLYGSYPDIINAESAVEKKERLEELSAAYLYKDILNLSGIKFADKLRNLLKLLALQVGSPVSIHELAKALQLNQETVMNYIDLLEKGFVIFRLHGYSNNLRKEITKMNKIYFYDLGVRNSLINNFNALDVRNDIGALWENFIISERLKATTYKREKYNRYYWRTYTGAELDYVEEKDGRLMGYEIKWEKSAKAPKTWLETYTNAGFQCINKENFREFLR